MNLSRRSLFASLLALPMVRLIMPRLAEAPPRIDLDKWRSTPVAAWVDLPPSLAIINGEVRRFPAQAYPLVRGRNVLPNGQTVYVKGDA